MKWQGREWSELFLITLWHVCVAGKPQIPGLLSMKLTRTNQLDDFSWMTERKKHVRMGQANGSSTFMAWKTCRSLLRASAGNLRYISIHRFKTMCISPRDVVSTWYISSSREKHFSSASLQHPATPLLKFLPLFLPFFHLLSLHFFLWHCDKKTNTLLLNHLFSKLISSHLHLLSHYYHFTLSFLIRLPLNSRLFSIFSHLTIKLLSFHQFFILIFILILLYTSFL